MVFVWRAVTFTSIGVVGLLTNVIVVFVMLKSKALMKIESIKFIVNQSLIDALTSFLIITSHMNLVDYLGVVQDNYKDNNLADEVLCRFWNFDLIQWSFNTASTINLVIMTVEKYLKIVHSIWYRAKVRTVHQRIALALPWILGPVYQLAIYLHTLDVIDNVCVLHIWPSVLLSRIVGIFAVSFEFFIPITLFIFCYSRILKTLRSRSERLNISNDTSSQARKYIESKTAEQSQHNVSIKPKGEESGADFKTTASHRLGETNPGFSDIGEDNIKHQNDTKKDETKKTSGEILDANKLQQTGSVAVKDPDMTDDGEGGNVSMFICCRPCKEITNKRFAAIKRKEIPEAGIGNNSIEKQNLKSQRKVIRILITVSVAFFLCWVCNQTIIFCTNIGLVDGDIFFSFLYTISGITAYMNCCVNPFIYVAQFHNFRHIAYNGLFKCKWND